MAKDKNDRQTTDFAGADKSTDNEAAELPLWRVNYGYTVNGALRSGSYILPANNPQEAKDKANKALTEKFVNTGSYFKIASCKPF